MKKKLEIIYQKLYSHFGPQHWWPARSAFEVIVGAILTQNTSWLNVERAIENLRKNKLLEPNKLYKLRPKKLASLIRPAGYYNIKTKRLREFLKFLFKSYGGEIKKMRLKETSLLREELLCVHGVGKETADSILLYALEKPVFVVDAYTKRIFLRHGFIKEGSTYEEVQNLFMHNLEKEAKLFNEYHALLVRLGKEFCLKSKPRCSICPLNKK